MAQQDWPQSLPGPLRAGYSVTGEQSVRRTQMETGPDEVRRIGNINVRTLPVAFVMDAEQRATFWAFYSSPDGANDGANWFDMPIDTINGVAWHRVRIINFPTTGLAGRKRRISFNVETDTPIEVL